MTSKCLASGHVGNNLSEEEKQEQIRDFSGYAKSYELNHGMIRVQPGNWFLPSLYLNYADNYFNFKFRPDDVLVMTLPKCGTTWTQEIVWTMIHNRNFDNPMADKDVNTTRVPFLEIDMLDTDFLNPNHPLQTNFKSKFPDRNPADGIVWQIAEEAPSPRVLKTHLPISFFNESIHSCKVIYVMRNPEDVVASFYHHSRLFKAMGYTGTFDQFVDYFINDKLLYSPFWPHVKEAWDIRTNKNMLFITYEDMKRKTEETYKKIDEFLGTELSSEEMQKIMEYTSFSAMKSREGQLVVPKEFVGAAMNIDIIKKDGGFFRKGQVGGSKEAFTPMQRSKLDVWAKKNAIEIGIKL